MDYSKLKDLKTELEIYGEVSFERFRAVVTSENWDVQMETLIDVGEIKGLIDEKNKRIVKNGESALKIKTASFLNTKKKILIDLITSKKVKDLKI